MREKKGKTEQSNTEEILFLNNSRSFLLPSNLFLERLGRHERRGGPRGDRQGLSGPRVTPGALGTVPALKGAKTRDRDLFAAGDLF